MFSRSTRPGDPACLGSDEAGSSVLRASVRSRATAVMIRATAALRRACRPANGVGRLIGDIIRPCAKLLAEDAAHRHPLIVAARDLSVRLRVHSGHIVSGAGASSTPPAPNRALSLRRRKTSTSTQGHQLDAARSKRRKDQCPLVNTLRRQRRDIPAVRGEVCVARLHKLVVPEEGIEPPT